MSQTQRTPGPWRLHERSNRAVISQTGHLIAEVSLCHKHIKTEDDRAETEANAAFIVQACNEYEENKRKADAHDDLVAALRECINQMKTNRAYYRGSRESNERINMTSAALLKGEKALQKAGVKS